MTYTAKIIIERSSAKKLLEDVEAVTYLLDHLRAERTRKSTSLPRRTGRRRRR